MARRFATIAAGFLAFAGCSADDSVSMVQQSLSAEQPVHDKRTKKEEWAKAKEEAGVAFRAERAELFEGYRIQERMAEERRQKKAAEEAEMAEEKAKYLAQQAAEKKAKQNELSALKLQVKEQHAATVKTKRQEKAALRTQVKDSNAAKKKIGQSEQAQLRTLLKEQVKSEWSAEQLKKKTSNSRRQAQPTAEKKGMTHDAVVKKTLTHVNFVDSAGNSQRLRLPKAAQMSLVMSAAGRRMGVDWEKMSFVHDGKALAAEDTLQSTGLQDNDIINVIPRA